MALSQWGRWDDEIEPVLLVELQLAFIRRVRWEARVMASEIGQLFAGEQGGEQDLRKGRVGEEWGVSASGKRFRRVSVDGLMGEMGAGFV